MGSVHINMSLRRELPVRSRFMSLFRPSIRPYITISRQGSSTRIFDNQVTLLSLSFPINRKSYKSDKCVKVFENDPCDSSATCHYPVFSISLRNLCECDFERPLTVRVCSSDWKGYITTHAEVSIFLPFYTLSNNGRK